MGLGFQRHEEEFERDPLLGPNPAQHEDNDIAGKFGVGLQGDFGRVDLRTELGTRVDFDDSAGASGQPAGRLVRRRPGFGRHDGSPGSGAGGPGRPAPVAPSCADMDDDGDGVNNCDDKCPGSQAGQTIGPDGCPVPVSIDLKGVNFDFDKSTLRPDAVAILNEAIEILKRYPELKVEVAGHTD